ncbi:hypothetical protein EVAR_18972_1 [Eumeta japonica]|uniref:Uncharacterized protein n=1 Tax=Eumeta variegata TaxID=151549 RepID=A0A4C1WWF6_EUMVA|nr:hypothetical protein EVAR_18972_1 [Eumeta japonica]
MRRCTVASRVIAPRYGGETTLRKLLAEQNIITMSVMCDVKKIRGARRTGETAYRARARGKASPAPARAPPPCTHPLSHLGRRSDNLRARETYPYTRNFMINSLIVTVKSNQCTISRRARRGVVRACGALQLNCRRAASRRIITDAVASRISPLALVRVGAARRRRGVFGMENVLAIQ